VRALTYDAYGPIERLRLSELPAPRPRSGEVTVEVRAAALNPKDALVRKGKFGWLSGRTFPKLVGLDLAGVVKESRSPHFREGDRVFGMLEELTSRRGTVAELVCVRETEIARLPEGVGFAEAASVALAGLTALQALRDLARVKPGTRVWIHGASGGVGTLALQLARLLGARVTTTTSAQNRDFVSSLGAHRALDYRAAYLDALRGEVDVVFDVFGNLRVPELAPVWAEGRGVYVNTIPTVSRLASEWLTRGRAVEERLVVVRARRQDLEELGGLLASGRLHAVIERRFPMARAHEAFRVLESKRTRGKLVIDVG
jgi:NADPH:quinone reductase-like Zn-dependent oxidoreductase